MKIFVWYEHFNNCTQRYNCSIKKNYWLKLALIIVYTIFYYKLSQYWPIFHWSLRPRIFFGKSNAIHDSDWLLSKDFILKHGLVTIFNIIWIFVFWQQVTLNVVQLLKFCTKSLKWWHISSNNSEGIMEIVRISCKYQFTSFYCVLPCALTAKLAFISFDFLVI